MILWLAVLAPAAGGAPAERSPDAPRDTPADVTRYLIIVVQRGQTLSQIALSFGVTVEAIVKANKLGDPNALRVGQTLVIPLPAGRPGPTSTRDGAMQWP